MATAPGGTFVGGTRIVDGGNVEHMSDDDMIDKD